MKDPILSTTLLFLGSSPWTLLQKGRRCEVTKGGPKQQRRGHKQDHAGRRGTVLVIASHRTHDPNFLSFTQRQTLGGDPTPHYPRPNARPLMTFLSTGVLWLSIDSTPFSEGEQPFPVAGPETRTPAPNIPPPGNDSEMVVHRRKDQTNIKLKSL